MEANIITATDSYKVSHYLQYPPGTETVYSFLESRGGVYPSVTFFGLQYLIKKHLIGVVVNEEKIQNAKRRFQSHFGTIDFFNEAGWKRIVEKHGGKFPVKIKAVPEGTEIPTGNVLMTVENTDPMLPWLTNYLETLLSHVWYPTTVATQGSAMRSMVKGFLEKTGDPSLIDFKVHDFGFRGSTSTESAGIGGAAHLVSFKGTDTLASLEVAEEFYGEPSAGFSIPAAEHSTMTSWGEENEKDAYEHMLSTFPTGFVAVVSDSYDIYRACEEIWGTTLREKVLARDGVLVIRPDSGNPPEVVVKVLEILGKSFGTTKNEKGYLMLNPKVRVIQGDRIDYEMLREVLDAVTNAGWSADNVTFGSGGGLLQKVNRDTQRFAFKTSAICVNGVWRDVMKNPITDPGKRSKAGRLSLVREQGVFKTVTQETAEREHLTDELKTVFENGTLLLDQKFSEIRERALKTNH